MMGAMFRWAPAGTPVWSAVVCALATFGLLALAAVAEAQVRIIGRTVSDTAVPVAGAEVVLLSLIHI